MGSQTLAASGKVMIDTDFEQPTVQPISIAGGAQAALRGVVTPYASNPAALTSSTDYSFQWQGSGSTPGVVVNHVLLQNNTATTLNYDIDTAATAGSLALASGAAVMLDIQMAALHLWQAGTPNVNGSSAANIVVRAWL